MSRILNVLILIILLLVVALAALNAVTVPLDYFLGSIEIALPWLMLATLFVGFLLGLLVAFVKVWSSRVENSRLRKEKRVMEVELKNLRSLPIRNAQQ